METATLLERPELGPDTLTARPYQDEAIDRVREELSRHRATVVIHPTGTGKTVLFCKISRRVVEKGGRVLILAHRGELIEQTANMLERVGILAGIEMAEAHARAAFDPAVVVGTVQSLQRDRLASWPEDHFRLLIVDEAHHATATTYRRIMNHFGRAKVLGVTATPDRADEDRLADVFDSVAHEMTIWQAMTAPPPGPYLCRLRYVQCDVGIDLRDIRTTGGDFNQADLEEKIRPLVDTLANAVRQEVGDRRTIGFTPDVGSAMAMATALQSLGVRADWVSGDDRDRGQKVAAYKQGEIQVLMNCQLVTEGFDAPATAAIVLCRPTKSRSLYSQMVGRGTRLSPGKRDCLLIDFNYLTEKHDLVRPADLFDSTETDPEVLEITQGLLKLSPGSDVAEVIERAREEQSRRQVLRIQARERQVKYRKVSYDPLAAADALGVAFRGSANAEHDPASDRQVALLTRLGITDAGTLSRRRASKLIGVMMGRIDKKLASMKQVSWLVSYGVPPEEARAMTMKEASGRLDALFGKGGGGRRTG